MVLFLTKSFINYFFCSPEEIEELKQVDIFEKLMEELARELPKLAKVVVEERDFYLGAYLKHVVSKRVGMPGSRNGLFMEIMLSLEKLKKLYKIVLREFTYPLLMKVKNIHTDLHFEFKQFLFILIILTTSVKSCVYHAADFMFDL